MDSACVGVFLTRLTFLFRDFASLSDATACWSFLPASVLVLLEAALLGEVARRTRCLPFVRSA